MQAAATMITFLASTKAALFLDLVNGLWEQAGPRKLAGPQVTLPKAP